MPRWHPVSISGYHIREAGSTAQQELAFTLKDGFTYVERALERGLDVDDFAPRLSFFFNAHIDFFEEIAKYRAARRIWARELRDTYGAKREESMRLRFHTQTAGVSLTAQQPLNNIVRTSLEALAAVLGGTQSLHTNSYDEALALPTEEAVRVALRTQQIIATESGVTNTADPLGGSWFVEKLTDEMEAAAYDYFARIDELGGMVEAIRRNFPQREIADASFTYQQELERAQADRRRRQRLHPRRTKSRPRSCASTRRSNASRSTASRRPAPAATAARSRRPGRAEAGRRRREQPDAADHRRRPRPRHRGRDDRRHAGGLRDLHRDPRLLAGVRMRYRDLRMRSRRHGGRNREDPRRRRQARPRRPRPRRQDHRPRPARRRHGGDLHRPAPDARADRRDGDPGGRRRGRPLDPLRRPHDAGAEGRRAARTSRASTTSSSPSAARSRPTTSPS